MLPELDEDGVRIALTIVDTPGFGDNIDNEFAYVRFHSRTGTSNLIRSLPIQLPGDRGPPRAPVR